MLTESDGSIILTFTIRSTGTVGITIRTPIHLGIHPIGQWAGDTAVGTHPITVGGGAIRLTTATGTGLIIPIMDTVIPIIRGMVTVDITEISGIMIMPTAITEKEDRPGLMFYMAKMLPEEIQAVWLPVLMEEIKVV